LTIPFSESRGRVIDQVIYSQNTEAAIVRWNDGAYSFIGYKPGYEAGDGTLQDEQWGDREFLEQEIIAAGVATKEQLDQRAIDRAEYAKRQQAKRLEAFRRLKQEFEPGE
jgi:PAS domain-containing protein